MGETTRAAKLKTLAAPLRPAQPPRYVRTADRPPALRRAMPADGWYWAPRDHPVIVFLARSYEEARDELLEILRREEDDDDG